MKSPHNASKFQLSKLKISKLCLIIVFLGIIKISSLSALILYSSSFNPSVELLSADIEKIIEKSKISSSSFSSVAIAAETVENTEANIGTPANPPIASTNSVPTPTPRTNSLVPKVNSMPSPISPESVRPDEIMPGEPPVPKVTPIIPNDSAKRKEEELNRREQELIQLQQQMNARLEELKAVEGRLGNMVEQATNTEDEKVKHLIDLYTNMKPKQAALALSTVDEKIAVKILAGMKGRQAGEILSYMDPVNTARLSEALTKVQMQ